MTNHKKSGQVQGKVRYNQVIYRTRTSTGSGQVESQVRYRCQVQSQDKYMIRSGTKSGQVQMSGTELGQVHDKVRYKDRSGTEVRSGTKPGQVQRTSQSQYQVSFIGDWPKQVRPNTAVCARAGYPVSYGGLTKVTATLQSDYRTGVDGMTSGVKACMLIL